VAFGTGTGRLVSGGEDRTIRVWDTADGRLVQEIDAHGQVTSLVAHPVDATLAWAVEGSRAIVVWDVERGQQRAELVGHDTQADSLSFSRDGSTLVSAGGGTIHVWDPSTGRETLAPLPLDTVEAAAVSPDGRTVASSQTWPPGLLLWNLRGSDDPIELATEGAASDRHPAFSPDGAMLAYSSGEAGLRVVMRRLANDQPAWVLDAPATVMSLTYTPDGRRLVTGHSNGLIAVWDADPGGWPQRACEIANRNLTRDEWASLVGSDLPYRAACSNLPVPDR
jgi:WD40 repeat protein